MRYLIEDKKATIEESIQWMIVKFAAESGNLALVQYLVEDKKMTLRENADSWLDAEIREYFSQKIVDNSLGYKH